MHSQCCAARSMGRQSRYPVNDENEPRQSPGHSPDRCRVWRGDSVPPMTQQYTSPTIVQPKSTRVRSQKRDCPTRPVNPAVRHANPATAPQCQCGTRVPFRYARTIPASSCHPVISIPPQHRCPMMRPASHPEGALESHDPRPRSAGTGVRRSLAPTRGASTSANFVTFQNWSHILSPFSLSHT